MAAWPSGPRTVPGARAGRNDPASVAISRAEIRNEPLSIQNGTDAATANRMPPSGGPANMLATTSAAYWRPLATSRRLGWTMAGSMAWAALSNSVSQKPMASAMA